MNAMPHAECRPLPIIAPLEEMDLPFDSSVEVVCTHASGKGSHSWPNAFYALDLASPYYLPAAIVRASADGKAFVFGAEDGTPCTEPKGTPANALTDACGMSWGNRVKVLHAYGYYSFYVHLEKALVKTGDRVKKGQPIGIEGWTGAAGHRHLHWSVQKLPGVNPAEWEQNISWDGESVPFHFRARLNGLVKSLNSAELPCAHANIGQAPPSEQPRLRGL